ncbi:hypothetical protein HPB48_000567 [Haemaphysalis longicornis]|uniref:FP protein C-terminal domain-containing protein n=1 Tax=Haemaphysalis longicornis TaxID=44386 RepID=A0A9J6G0J6_HAELO|nr:hypothetical protein HPB48_000567 [Haemaphysalis longicornis]
MSSEIAKLLKDFKQEMREMRTALEKEFRKEYKELKSSIDFFSTQFDSMATRCAKIEKENAALKKDNAALLAGCQSFKKLVTTSEQRLTDLEQYSRNKNVEIKGIPAAAEESLPAILQQLGNAIAEPITEADVDICHRVPKKDGGCPNIVVQFKSRVKRDAVIDKARKKRLNASTFKLEGNSHVFVNDHLCPVLKKLLGEDIARKNEKKWKYTWTKGGKIYPRRTDESRTLRVTSLKDIEKIQ